MKIDLKRLLAATLLVASAAPAAAEMPTAATLGTGPAGGTLAVYGAAWGALVQEATGVTIVLQDTGGAVDNAGLVGIGELDLGMSTLRPIEDALQGGSPAAPGRALTDLRALFPMYRTPLAIVALRSSGIDAIADLEGRVVGVGPEGSTSGELWPGLLTALGVRAEIRHGALDALKADLLSGAIDAFAYAGGTPLPAFTEIATAQPSTIFGISAEAFGTLSRADATLAADEIPAGAYPGQAAAVPTVAIWNFAIANAAVPDDFAYAIMKAVLEDPRLQAAHPSAAETIVANWDKDTVLPFHPGAVRYLEEKGITVPPALLPPAP
jgi:TRAP transporter TAXI family solute receptor